VWVCDESCVRHKTDKSACVNNTQPAAWATNQIVVPLMRVGYQPQRRVGDRLITKIREFWQPAKSGIFTSVCPLRTVPLSVVVAVVGFVYFSGLVVSGEGRRGDGRVPTTRAAQPQLSSSVRVCQLVNHTMTQLSLDLDFLEAGNLLSFLRSGSLPQLQRGLVGFGRCTLDLHGRQRQGHIPQPSSPHASRRHDRNPGPNKA
jgi:hypothetical protein